MSRGSVWPRPARATSSGAALSSKPCREDLNASTGLSEGALRRTLCGPDVGGADRRADIDRHDGQVGQHGGQDVELLGREEKRGGRLRQEDDERLRQEHQSARVTDLARYEREPSRCAKPT